MFQDDLEQVIERYHHSIDAFLKGDAGRQKPFWSRHDDVTVANPLGPPARGWRQVEETMDQAAALLQDGELLGAERVSGYTAGDLAYIVEIERQRVKPRGTSTLLPVSLRVTTVFRREDGAWRIVHRHADAITTPRSITSVLEQGG